MKVHLVPDWHCECGTKMWRDRHYVQCVNEFCEHYRVWYHAPMIRNEVKRCDAETIKTLVGFVPYQLPDG